MTNLLDRLVEFESDIQYRIPPPPGAPEFTYEAGRLPVLLSAPHGAAHTRQGELKAEDEYTAAFVRLLAFITGAHALYARYQSGSDPNFDANVPYKKMLAKVVNREKIRFVLDLHGAKEDKNFGLALGTMKNESCPGSRDLIIDTLTEAGFSKDEAGLRRLDIDRAFPGAGSTSRETVTRFAWRTLGVPAAQLELNANLRIVRRLPGTTASEPFSGSPHLIETALQAIQQLTIVLSVK